MLALIFRSSLIAHRGVGLGKERAANQIIERIKEHMLKEPMRSFTARTLPHPLAPSHALFYALY